MSNDSSSRILKNLSDTWKLVFSGNGELDYTWIRGKVRENPNTVGFLLFKLLTRDGKWERSQNKRPRCWEVGFLSVQIHSEDCPSHPTWEIIALAIHMYTWNIHTSIEFLNKRLIYIWLHLEAVLETGNINLWSQLYLGDSSVDNMYAIQVYRPRFGPRQQNSAHL